MKIKNKINENQADGDTIQIMMHVFKACKMIIIIRATGVVKLGKRVLRARENIIVIFITGCSLKKILALEVKDTFSFPEVFIIS